ncbi:MAG TPA: hypothetical protein VFJ19_01655 [Nocardioidaceae bacterium]|nr:hypothetical protein [Nocardioidaceae bacterium]
MSTRTGLRTWLQRAGLAFVVWLGVCAGTYALGGTPRPGLVALTIVAVAAVLILFLDLSASTEASVWDVRREQPLLSPGEDPGLARLNRMLTAHQVGNTVDSTLHDHLVGLLDQRLLARHGVTWSADPVRAATLVHPDLVRFAEATSPYPRLKPAQIDVLIDRIEAL